MGEEGGESMLEGESLFQRGERGRLEAVGLRRRPQERTLLCSGKDLLPSNNDSKVPELV